MILIEVPEYKQEEIGYVLDVIFTEFLQIDYEKKVTSNQSNTYKIILENGATILLKDKLFVSYCNEPFNFPRPKEKLERLNHPKFSVTNLPIIYGEPEIKFFDKENLLKCNVDIFGSIFFMLTRIEEVNSSEHDNHDRVFSDNSLAYKNDFFVRPIVNEYVNLLWEIFEYFGVNQKKKENKFEIISTHDIDFIRPKFNIKTLLADLILTKSIKTPIKRIAQWIRNENTFDVFNWLMLVSEKNGLKSRFYFLSNGKSIKDNGFRLSDPLFLDIIQRIKKRNHIIGFHPGYDTFDNPKEWKRQKSELEDVIQKKVIEGRQHYLRFKIPNTWRIWEENNMRLDTTLGYSLRPGFRCGTSMEFTVFDVKKRSKLKLKEQPLVAMDTTFNSRRYLNKTLNDTYNELNGLKSTCKQFNIPFTILFHNSSFEPLHWKGWKDLYEKLLTES